MKHATISPKTFTIDEFYGNPPLKQTYATELKLHESIFSLILKGYKEEKRKNVLQTVIFDSVVENTWEDEFV